VSDPAERIAAALSEQAGWCRRLGSPLYAALLDEAARDAAARGPLWAVLAGHEDDPPGSALALRLMGAVHRLVLTGRAPALARHYPSAGGEAGADGAWPPFRDLVAAEQATLRPLIDRPVQTNEVGRSAALLGGFLTVAQATGLSLRLLEIGASAGLNLRWDRFHYRAGSWTWGDPDSPVRFDDVFAGACPPPVAARVATREGCDRHPVDPTTDDGVVTLRSYLWPDQAHRQALLGAAIAVARREPAAVDAASADAWLARRLASPVEGVATVVYHSITWQYLTSEERHATRAAIERAGAQATSEAPLARLSLEPASPTGPYVVRLTTWPGGTDRALAEASPHGAPVRWAGPVA